MLSTVPFEGVKVTGGSGPRFATTNEEGLGAPGEGLGGVEDPTPMLEPPTATPPNGPAELAPGPTGETVTVGEGVALPEGDAGVATVPAAASAAALNMMIDTTMANPTARLRGDKMRAFIAYLGGGY